MIKFVYFDVGGVVVEDFSGSDKWEKMKKVMGVRKEFDKEFDSLYDKYELEELCLTRPVDSLIPIFSKKFGFKFPENFSLQKYFIDHFDRNKSIWLVIYQIRKKCKVGLLTNMYVDMFQIMKKRGLFPPLIWDAIIDSSIVGIQKPDPAIFKLSEKKCGFAHKEIVFVENNQKNIEAARKFGWNTFLYDPKVPKKSSKKLLEYFREEMLK